MDIFYEESDISSIAGKLQAILPVSEAHAVIVALHGDIGAGKTTLVREIARQWGVQELVVSPTFVVAKYYQTQQGSTLVHIDAYRIQSEEEFHILNWDTLIQTPHTYIFIEWPQHVEQLLPEHTLHVVITEEKNGRRIRYEKK